MKTKAQEERQAALQHICGTLKSAQRELTCARTMAAHFGIDVDIPHQHTLDTPIEQTVQMYARLQVEANG